MIHREPLFLFILTLTNSGSTTLASVIATSPHAFIIPHGMKEGQMLPSVKAIMREQPWNPEFDMPWDFIRREWLKEWDPTKKVFIEKSPPNLVRVPRIMQHFPGSRYVVLMRDPYAYCASCWKGYCIKQPKTDFLRRTAAAWLTRAAYQVENLKLAKPSVLITYEQFTADPQGTARTVLGLCPELGQLDADSRLHIKGFEGKIVNRNLDQIAMLSQEEIGLIGEELSKRGDLLDFFGYRILNPGDEVFDLIRRDHYRARGNHELAQHELALGRLDKAEASQRKAIALNSEDGDLWYQLSWILSKAGRLTESLEALDRAVGLNPDNLMYQMKFMTALAEWRNRRLMEIHSQCEDRIQSAMAERTSRLQELNSWLREAKRAAREIDDPDAVYDQRLQSIVELYRREVSAIEAGRQRTEEAVETSFIKGVSRFNEALDRLGIPEKKIQIGG